MRLPRILIGAALIAAGLFAPSAIPAPDAAPAGAIGMEHEAFAGPDTVTVAKGSYITFVNDSGWLHVIGSGTQGQVETETGPPSFGKYGLLLSESGDTYTSGPWEQPGTYRLTCQLHQKMNITVVVTA